MCNFSLYWIRVSVWDIKRLLRSLPQVLHLLVEFRNLKSGRCDGLRVKFSLEVNSFTDEITTVANTFSSLTCREILTSDLIFRGSIITCASWKRSHPPGHAYSIIRSMLIPFLQLFIIIFPYKYNKMKHTCVVCLLTFPLSRPALFVRKSIGYGRYWPYDRERFTWSLRH